MTDTTYQARLERLLDRTEIFDLVRFERLCRDQRDFAGMVACYVPRAPVRTTWFEGTVEEFAEASRKKMGSGSQAKHWIMPARLEINESRALVEFKRGDFDKASAVAEQRLGMSSLEAHGASHIAPFMPKAMQEIGEQMHRAASRFAVDAQNASVTNDVKPALASLAAVMQQCVACHAAYRLH